MSRGEPDEVQPPNLQKKGRQHDNSSGRARRQSGTWWDDTRRPGQCLRNMGSTIAVVEASAWPKQPASAGVKLPALVDALEEALQTVTDKAEAADKDWYAAPLGELVQSHC